MMAQQTSRKEFLTVLFEAFLQKAEGYIETKEIFTGQEPIKQAFHRTLDSIVNYVPTGNYFFGVCPRLKEKGKEADIEVIVALWVDMDMEIAVALRILEGFPHKPSIVVDSGHGVHVYWLLKSPEQVNVDTKGILKGLSLALKADKCFDLSRVLRVPNTKNLKDLKNPKDVRVFFFEPDRRYSLSDFDSYKTEVQEKSQAQVIFSNEKQKVDLESLKLPEQVKKLIEEGKQEGDKYPSRSEADYCVTCALIKTGHSDDTIKTIFDAYPIGEKYREKGIEYLRHIIGRARQAVRANRNAVNTADIYDLFSDGSYRLNLQKARQGLLGQHQIIYSGGSFYEYRDGCYVEVNIEVVKKWIMDLIGAGLTKKRTEEIIYFLQAEVFVDITELNKAELLNVKNGLLKLNNLELLEHSPDIYSTIQLDVAYNSDAQCGLWIKTLEEIFPDEDGKQKINTLQEFFGLCLTKETRYEKALLCVGEGSNGKSVVLWILQHLLKKENISAIPLEKFDNSHYLINLFGKLANISIETNAKSEVYDSIFKAVVTGDPIQADQKFKAAILFNPFCKLVFATNNLPRVDDKSDAFFRRLLILRFNRQFSEIEQNKNLKYELLSELNGILLWCLEGLRRLEMRGYFETSVAMQKEIDEYRVDNNNVILFVNEDCILSPDATVTMALLYGQYVVWCKYNGCPHQKQIRFGKELKRQFKEITKETGTNGRHLWNGISLRPGILIESVNKR